MNQVPAELRTPPLPVIAFVNCAELHKDIGTYFNTYLRPPLFFVSLPEANEAVLGRLFGKGCIFLVPVWCEQVLLRKGRSQQAWCMSAGTPKQAKAFHTPDGILKASFSSTFRTQTYVTCYLLHRKACVVDGGYASQPALSSAISIRLAKRSVITKPPPSTAAESEGQQHPVFVTV